VAGAVRGQPARLIVDTGASALVLDTAFAERLGVDPTTAVPAVGAGQLPVPQFAGAPIRLAGKDIACPTGVVLDLGGITVNGGPAADGILGYDLFAGHAVELDFPARRLRIREPGSTPAAPPAAMVPISTAERIPTAEATLVPRTGEPVQGRFVLDAGTGGDVGVVLGPDLVAAHPQLAPASMPGTAAAAGIGAAGVRVTAVPLRELRVGDLRLANPAAGVIATSEGAFHAGLFDGTIGFGLFHDRVVTIDYPNDRMIIS
jgi:aspartyl protease